MAVGVAAYPTRHPESPSEAHDVEVLLAKQRSGADFAITQVFFHTEQYAAAAVPGTPGRRRNREFQIHLFFLDFV